MTKEVEGRCFAEITNISSLLDTPTLSELFECCGHIERIEMVKDNDSNDRICIVQFSNSQESEAAALLSGTLFGDKSIQVKQRDLSEVESKLSKSQQKTTKCESSATPLDVVEAARRQVEEWANAPPVPDRSNVKKSEADKRRDEQISRTIYVGNLCPQLKAEHIRTFFATQGEIKFVKMSGPGMDNPYCFVEFVDVAAAERAHTIAGTVLGDRPIKVGRVKTPIQGTTGIPTNILNNPMKLSKALSNARFALEAIERKKKDCSRSSRRSKERRRRRRSRSYSSSRSRSYSRSRSRRSRSRRKRRRRRYHSRSHSRRSHSRSRGRLRRAFAGNRNSNYNPKDMVWDGFNWHPKESVEGIATKKAAEIGAAGLKVGNSSGYVNNQTGAASTWGLPDAPPGGGANSAHLGRELAQKALESFMYPIGNL